MANVIPEVPVFTPGAHVSFPLMKKNWARQIPAANIFCNYCHHYITMMYFREGYPRTNHQVGPACDVARKHLREHLDEELSWHTE